MADNQQADRNGSGRADPGGGAAPGPTSGEEVVDAETIILDEEFDNDEPEAEFDYDELEETTKEKLTRRLIHASVALALILIAGSFLFVRHQREEERQRQIQTDKAKHEVLIQKALSDFGADAGWEQRVRNSFYTADFENEWVGKTIAFRGRILDVITSGPESDRVLFEYKGILAFSLHSVSFSLTCPIELVRDSIAGHDSWTTYFVVAEIARAESIRGSDGDFGTLGIGSCRAIVPNSTYLSD